MNSRTATKCGSLGSMSLLCAISVLSGCTTVGSGDFACPGRPTGVRCASATEVYAMTEGTDRIGSTADKELGDDPKRAIAARQQQAQRIAGEGGTPAEDDRVEAEPTNRPPPTDDLDTEWLQASTQRGSVLLAIDKPIPVRTPAQVMRVWIAPWEDAKGVLHIGGYAFIEIHKRRWEIGEQHAFEPVRLFSIQDPFPEAVNVGGKARAVPPAAVQASDSEQRKRQ